MASTVVGNLVVNLRATAKEFGRDLTRAQRSVRNFGASLFKLRNIFIATLGAVAVRQVIGLGKSLFDLGSTVGETASKFTTVFGESTDAVQAFLDTFATTAGLSREQGRAVTATTGAIVQGMGFAGQAAADFSIEVTRLAGDLASFNNVPIAETARAIQAALTGERESLKRLGIVVNEADVQQRALLNTGKKLTSQLTATDKATASFQLIMERAGVAVGDLERTSDSAANRAKALGAEWRTIQEDFAEDLLPTLEGFLPVLEQMADVAARAAPPIAALVTKLLSLLGLVDTDWIDWIEDFNTKLSESEDQSQFLANEYDRLVRTFERLDDQLAKIGGESNLGAIADDLREQMLGVSTAIEIVQAHMRRLRREAETIGQAGSRGLAALADPVIDLAPALPPINRDLSETVEHAQALPSPFRDAAAAARETIAEIEALAAQLTLVENVALDFALRFSDTLGDALIDGASAFKRFADSVIRDIARIIARFAVFKVLSAIPGLGPIAGAFGALSGFTGNSAITDAREAIASQRSSQSTSSPVSMNITLVGQGGASASRQITVEQGRAGGRDQVVNIPAFVMVGS